MQVNKMKALESGRENYMPRDFMCPRSAFFSPVKTSFGSYFVDWVPRVGVVQSQSQNHMCPGSRDQYSPHRFPGQVCCCEAVNVCWLIQISVEDGMMPFLSRVGASGGPRVSRSEVSSGIDGCPQRGAKRWSRARAREDYVI
jgi:hypothetical protein